MNYVRFGNNRPPFKYHIVKGDKTTFCGGPKRVLRYGIQGKILFNEIDVKPGDTICRRCQSMSDSINPSEEKATLDARLKAIPKSGRKGTIKPMQIINNLPWPADVKRMKELSSIRLPFGKYEGLNFGSIPLSYLDRTVSPMPTCWIVRRTIEFVAGCMETLMANENGDWDYCVPNKPFKEIEIFQSIYFA
jgi:uncharacterized protein (DUF3820 family)